MLLMHVFTVIVVVKIRFSDISLFVTVNVEGDELKDENYF